MMKRLFGPLATIMCMAACLGVGLTAEPALDGALSRYPGAVRVEGEMVDAYHLNHGWVSRQAVYQSPDDMSTITRWYAGYLPQAEMHEGGTCLALRQSQTILHILRTISVLLCELRPGTRIMLQEDVYLSP